MRKPQICFFGAFAVSVILFGVSFWSLTSAVALSQEATRTATPTSAKVPTEDSWIIVELSPNATQLEYGAEVYRLVCKACHGDKGQGLTDDWRVQWNSEDQNCWQSKCHALNHPPDGFYLPVSPAVVGPPLQIFESALDLYNYIHKYMPWHDPGSMTEKESWSVTAYILKINHIDTDGDLGAENARDIRLRPLSNIVSPTETRPISPSFTPSFSPSRLGGVNASKIGCATSIALILAAMFLFIKRSFKR